jgi:hypothetical protein
VATAMIEPTREEHTRSIAHAITDADVRGKRHNVPDIAIKAVSWRSDLPWGGGEVTGSRGHSRLTNA